MLVALIQKWEDDGIGTLTHDTDTTVRFSEDLGHSLSGGVELYGVQELVLEVFIVKFDLHVVRVVVLAKESDTHEPGSIHKG